MLPAAPRPALLDRLAALEAALGLAGDAILRLAALAVEVPEDADRLRERLRLSNEEHARLCPGRMRAPDLGPSAPERAAKACLYADGEAAYRERVLDGLGALGRCAREPGLARAPRPSRALAAAAVSPRRRRRHGARLPAGPRVGELLRALEAWWIAGDFAADAIALRAELQRLVASSQV